MFFIHFSICACIQMLLITDRRRKWRRPKRQGALSYKGEKAVVNESRAVGNDCGKGKHQTGRRLFGNGRKAAKDQYVRSTGIDLRRKSV